jgi:hypothetical protein
VVEVDNVVEEEVVAVVVVLEVMIELYKVVLY